MLPPIYIATLAGVVSALLLLAPQSQNILGFITSAFASLPIAIVALGWGIIAGIQAGLAGFILMTTLALILNISVFIPIGYALATVSPVLILSHLFYLSRSSLDQNKEETTKLEWYPIGDLFFWAAIIASAMAVMLTLNIGANFDSYMKTISLLVDDMIKVAQKAQKVTLTSEQLKQLEQIKYPMAHYIPMILGASALLHILLNFWLAAKITLSSNMLMRPWPNIRMLETTHTFFVIFAISLTVAAFIPGMTRLFALCFTGAYFIASVMIGLTVIHTITARIEFRTLLLVALYLTLFVWPLSIFTACILAIFGFAEPIFKLKQRALEKASGNRPDSE